MVKARLILGLMGALVLCSPGFALEPQVIVRNYALDVAFFPERSQMEGKAGIVFEPVEEGPKEIVFFLHGELSVDSIKAGTGELEFKEEKVFYRSDYSRVATRVEAALGRKSLDDGLVVRYSGYFHPSKARSPSDYMRIDHDAVLLRSYGYSLWFPIFLEERQNSYKVSFSKATIRTPADFRSVFVGQKIREKEEGSQWVTEWEAEHVDLFTAQCTAQRYAVTEKEGYFIYHYEDEASRKTAESIQILAEKLSAFFKKHYRTDAETAQVHIMQMPRYGNISSGNVVGISTEAWHLFEPTSSSARLFAHELVHTFVQPPVDRAESSYALVIEGFPSYFHLPALAEILGESYYESLIKTREEQYLQKKETGTDRRGRKLPAEKPIMEITADEIGIYKDVFILSDRVLLFFHYLRSKMGKERFLVFGQELFNRERLDSRSFEETILRFVPGAEEDLHVWLRTTEYPDRFHLRR